MSLLSRFWVGVVKACRFLPMRVRRGLAAVAAAILWYAVPARRRVTLRNLELCFPEMNEKARLALARTVYRRLARAVLDHGVLWSGTREDVRALVRFEGLEHLLARRGKPTIVVAPHFAGLDAAGIALNTYVRGVSLYQTQSNPVWDEAILAGRKRFSDPVLIAKSDRSDLRPVIREIKSGLPFYYLPDMDHGRQNSIFVNFFGVSAATLPMVSRLARVTRAEVLWCIATMTDEGYRVIISEPWAAFPTEDFVEDTQRVNRELEGWIRRYPDQYLWVHRRFKTRPDGEPSLY